MSACSGIGIEFFERPYRYDRFPFRLGIGDDIPFSGIIYSQPAFAAITDQRLFTSATSHPVTSPLKLYINKVAGKTIDELEPDLDAVGYESGCINYTDYITDIRDVLDDVFTLHAGDSVHDATAFKIAHLRRQRTIYQPIEDTSASGTLDTDYIHSKAVLTQPSGGELGASGIQDIDVDEIQYQPFVRPTKRRTTIVKGNPIPFQPFFPAVITTGGRTPNFGPQDVAAYDELGLDVSSSGNKLLVTGDRLLEGTSLKVMSANSGTSVLGTGAFSDSIPWALYPAKDQMCNYLDPVNSGTMPLINASGRQALYDVPSLAEGVYLTAVSEDTVTSGNQIQHYPKDWVSLTGADSSGVLHDGLYVEDSLIFSIRDMGPGGAVRGRSKQNGRALFAHIVGDETGPFGNGLGGGDMAFAHEDEVYSFGGLTGSTDRSRGQREFGIGYTIRKHTLTWQKGPSVLSPASTVGGTADGELGSSMGFRAWHPGKTGDGMDFGILLVYVLGGFIDVWLTSNSPTSTAGVTEATINYVIRTFTASASGPFKEEPFSPQFQNTPLAYYQNSFNMENFFSFFVQRNGFKGMVNVNGNVYMQFGKPLGFRREARLLTRPTVYNTTCVPASTYSKVCNSIGFFPSWAIVCVITTNNQFCNVATTLNWGGPQILNEPGFPHFTDNDVGIYGPPVWDEDNNVNYLYVKLLNGEFWFCKMNTSFEIFEANRVDEIDAIMLGPMGILSL